MSKIFRVFIENFFLIGLICVFLFVLHWITWNFTSGNNLFRSENLFQINTNRLALKTYQKNYTYILSIRPYVHVFLFKCFNCSKFFSSKPWWEISNKEKLNKSFSKNILRHKMVVSDYKNCVFEQKLSNILWK